MPRLLSRLFQLRSSPSRPVRVRLELLALEDRSVPSATPLGGEVLANTTLDGWQRYVDTAMSADGRYVVVWESGYGDPPFRGYDVFGRLYDQNGTAIGGEFDVTTTDDNDNGLPKVAMDATGRFVVVWHSGTVDDHDIRARVFAANGQPLGNDFAISTRAVEQTTPAVAMDGAGNFVVVWQETHIMARRYSLSGGQPTAIDQVEFQVNANLLPDPNPQTPRTVWEPSVAMDNGNAVVAWTVDFGELHPGEPILVVARTMTFANAPGTSLPAFSSEFFVNNIYEQPDPPPGYELEQHYTSVAISNNGLAFVIAYHQVSLGAHGPSDDPFLRNVFARVFAIDPQSPPASTPATAAIMVNIWTAGVQFAPDVAMDATGNFVVAWLSSPPGGSPQDGSGAGVFARTFTSNGTGGTEFQVNQTTTNDQTYPAIALSDSGLMAIAWQSWNQYDTDGDGIPDSEWDVFSRRYSVTFP